MYIRKIDSYGIHIDSYGIHIDSYGIHIDSHGIHIDSHGISLTNLSDKQIKFKHKWCLLWDLTLCIIT